MDKVKRRKWAREVTRGVKCWLHTHKNYGVWRSELTRKVKFRSQNQGSGGGGRIETGRTSGVYWPANLAKSVSSS